MQEGQGGILFSGFSCVQSFLLLNQHYELSLLSMYVGNSGHTFNRGKIECIACGIHKEEDNALIRGCPHKNINTHVYIYHILFYRLGVKSFRWLTRSQLPSTNETVDTTEPILVDLKGQSRVTVKVVR